MLSDLTILSSLPSVAHPRVLLAISSLHIHVYLLYLHCFSHFSVFCSWCLCFLFLFLSYCHSSGTFFCVMFLPSCFFPSWFCKFPGNTVKALGSRALGRRVLGFGLVQLPWTLISDRAFCTQNTCFLLHLKTHFQKADFFLLFTSKRWNPVFHSLSFSEWFWMLGWDLCLHCFSRVLGKKKKNLFPRFF